MTTIALPNLVANELVIVKPMTSMTGYIQYLQFVAGTNKGGVEQGDVFNDPFKLGAMTDERVNYTSSSVVEAIDTQGATADYKFAWTPSASTAVKAYVSGAWVEVATSLCVIEDGKVVGIKKDAFADGTKVAYSYDNIVIPQNDIPVLNAKMTGIALEAKARRIAIYY